MNHLTDLQFSMYVDGALPSDDANDCLTHIGECSICQAKLAIFEQDQQVISAALLIGSTDPVPKMAPPKFKNPVGLREFAVANVVTGLLFWLAQFSSKAIFGEIVVDGFAWLTSFFVPDFYDLTVTTILFFTNEGITMIETYSGYIIATIVALASTWLLVSVYKSKRGLSFCLLTLLLGGGMLMPEDAAAIEFRRDNLIVASTESINDTLLFAGESIVVDGNIEGDLIAFGRRVVVTGTIKGNLIAFAESLSISGEISGTTINAGNSVELTDVVLHGDFWGAGESVQISRDSRIAGNVTVAAQLASIQGSVGRDLTAGAEAVELRGRVGEDMVAYAKDIKLLGEASIVGDLTIHSSSEDGLSRSSASKVGGTVSFEHHDDQGRSRNKYATAKFYGFQVLRLAAAFIVAYGLFRLFPSVRTVSLNGGMSGFVTAGIGLVSVVSLPIILLIVGMTIVGLPITVFGFFTWLFGLYLAKIMVAWLIGDMLFNNSEGEEKVALPLLAGLAIVVVAINVPFIGGIVSFLFTVVGIGMLVQWIIARYSSTAAYR